MNRYGRAVVYLFTHIKVKRTNKQVNKQTNKQTSNIAREQTIISKIRNTCTLKRAQIEKGNVY